MCAIAWAIVALLFVLLFPALAHGQPLQPYPWGNICTDPVWQLKGCDNQPIPLGSMGSNGDCANHALTVGQDPWHPERSTPDRRLYSIIGQCTDTSCQRFPRPADTAGAFALDLWDKCYTGTELERRGVRPSCIGRAPLPGRQVIRLYTLFAVPMPETTEAGRLAHRLAIARARGCDLGLPTSTPAPPTRTGTVTNRTPSRTRTPAPSGCTLPTEFNQIGVPTCTMTPNRTRSRTPSRSPTASPGAATRTPVGSPIPPSPRPTTTSSAIATSTPTTVPATPRPSPTPTKPPGSGCGNRSGAGVAVVVAGAAVWGEKRRGR
jgi:hypothetical protein